MPVYRTPDGRWRYRVQLRLPNQEEPLRISGCAPKHDNTKLAATQAERDHIARVQRGEAVPKPKPVAEDKTETAIILRDFAADFTKTYVRTNNKPSEQKAKEKILRRYLLPTLGAHRLSDIRAKEIEALKAELLDRGLSRKTVNNALAVLGKILRYAHEIEVLKGAVPRIRMLKVEKTKFSFLDFEQYDALLQIAKQEPEWYAAILLGGDAGLRFGEIRALKWEDWDRRADKLTIARSFWEDIEGTTKGWKLRTVPLTRRLSAALASIRHLRGPFVFGDAEEGGKQSPLTIETMRWHLPRLCTRAGLQPIGWHALRHTFCSHLALRGAPARVIQELAGHASLTTTLQYMHLVAGATDDAIALLERGGKIGGKTADRDAAPSASG